MKENKIRKRVLLSSGEKDGDMLEERLEPHKELEWFNRAVKSAHLAGASWDRVWLR